MLSSVICSAVNSPCGARSSWSLQLVRGVGDVAARELHGVGPVAVAVLHGDGGVLAHGGVGDAAVVARAIATVVPLGYHEVLAHAEHLTYIIGGVQTGGVAAIEGVIHQAVLIDVVAREHERTLLAAVAHRGREVVGPSRGEYLFLRRNERYFTVLVLISSRRPALCRILP